jgi:hypothetical protein
MPQSASRSLAKVLLFDLYRSKMNPALGRNFEAMDPLEWLARMADHIPDPGKHRTHFYAHYANRVRGEQPPEEGGSQGPEEGATQEAPLLAELGEAHRQRFSRGSPGVQTLRWLAPGRCLHHRHRPPSAASWIILG